MSNMKVSKQLILEACDNAIRELEALRLSIFNREVEKVMTRWLFPIKDRAKAEKYVKDTASDFAEWKWKGWRTSGRAELLKEALSVSADDNIMLDVDDASFVAEWISNNQ